MSIDRALEQAVSRRLLHDDHVSALDVKVEAIHGVVTLRGAVPTARAKLAAHDVAAGTPGCTVVINDLKVVPAGALSDADVAERVGDLLDAHPELTRGAITVHVVGGVATLSGAVGSPEEYTVAEDLARSARGVRCVHNQLIIDREAQSDDESLQLEIQSALDEVRELEEVDLKVAVSGDLIVLSGLVQTDRQRELAAEAVMGVRAWRVRNEIVVAGSSSSPEP